MRRSIIAAAVLATSIVTSLAAPAQAPIIFLCRVLFYPLQNFFLQLIQISFAENFRSPFLL